MPARSCCFTANADWAIRCNLVNVDREQMRDFTAGHISNDVGAELLATLQKSLGGPVKFAGLKGTLEFHAGVSYRNILRGSTDCDLSRTRRIDEQTVRRPNARDTYPGKHSDDVRQ